MPPTIQQIERVMELVGDGQPRYGERAWDYVVEECAKALQARAWGMLPTKSQEAQIAADTLADAIDMLREMKTNATDT